VLAHKLREAFNAEIVGQTLDDEVEIDGSCYDGQISPDNNAEHRVDRLGMQPPPSPPGRT